MQTFSLRNGLFPALFFVLSPFLGVFGQENGAVFEKTYEKPLAVSVYVWSIDMDKPFMEKVRKLEKRFIRAEMEVSGTDENLLAGAKFKIFAKDRKNTVLAPLFWRRKVTGEKRVFKGEFALSTDEFSRMLFLVYNCGEKGTLCVHRIRVEISDVPLPPPAPAKKVKKPVKASPPPEPEETTASAVFEKNFESPLKVTKYVWSLDMDKKFSATVRKLKNQDLKVEMEVSSEDPGTLAGAKVKIFSKKKGGTLLAPIFWKKKAAAEKRVYKGEYAAKAEEASKAQFLIYNCGEKGTLLVHRIRVTVSGDCRTKEEMKKKSGGKTIDPKGPVPLTPLAVKRDFFPAGVYFYLSEKVLGGTPEEAEKKFRACMKDLADHSCNTVYLSGLSGNAELLNKYCKIAGEYGLKVFAQGNGPLYVQPGKGPDYFESVTLKAMRRSLPRIHGENLEGFTVKEEVDPEPYAVDLMRRAREEQKALMKNVSAYTLHNRLDAMAMDDDPARQPDWYSFDMYRFKLHPARNVIMTPSKAANRIRTNLEIAYLHAAGFGRPLIFTGQAVKVYTTVKSTKYTRASGFKEVSPGVWKGYARYMPKNAMYLQFYLAVMSGCRGFLAYHYMSSASEQSLVDKDLKPAFYWTEMGECLKEVKKLFPLFASWYKQPLSPELKTSSATVPVREFRHPDFPGRFLLPVNTLIAHWDKTNPILAGVKTQLYSDEENLQGFQWADPQSFSLLLSGEEKLYDLLTGNEADAKKITLEPGRGRIFYQGKKKDLDAVRARYGL